MIRIIWMVLIGSFFSSCSEKVNQEKEQKPIISQQLQNQISPEEEETRVRLKHIRELLLLHYSDHITAVKENTITWRDGSESEIDDGRKKSTQELLDEPDIEDMFHYEYFPSNDSPSNEDRNNAGRIRNEAFFKKVYGETKEEVNANMVTIDFQNQKLRITSINGLDSIMTMIDQELTELIKTKPEYAVFLQKPGGTFNWRKISGTDRLSSHSFGMTIDLNVSKSHYWRWSLVSKAKKEGRTITEEDIQYVEYNNLIPLEIVAIFEKHGFIWGGSWLHFDTMHFEYRPALIQYSKESYYHLPQETNS